MKAMKDIEFLDNHWKEVNKVALRIKNELGNGEGEQLKAVGSVDNKARMYIVNYSDLGKSWLPKDIINEKNGRSTTLQILARKIYNMILSGNSSSVKLMVEKICTGRIKSFSQGLSKADKEYNKKLGYTKYTNNFLGRGHFRWDYKVHILTVKEIEALKRFFDIQ